MVESSDDDLDDKGPQKGSGLLNLWDDDRRGDEDDEGDMSTDSFIEYSDEEEGAGNEESREQRRQEKKKDNERRKRARRVLPELAGIDAKCVCSSFCRAPKSQVSSVLGLRYTMSLGTAMTMILRS